MSLDKRREVQKTAGKDKNGSIDDKTKRDDKTADKRDPKAAEKEKSARDEGRRHATLKDEDNSDESSDDYLSSEEDTSWIQWFCSLRGNEFFVEVDEDYINDDFNLTGLSSIVPNYDYALDMILDSEPDEVLTEEQQEIIESAAEMLYGLIHARFILTSRGLAAMVEKYNNVEFGRCPRVFCQGCPVVPVGQSDVPRTNTVKIFCPKCEDIYYPKYSKHAHLDGAYFGTTFPHLMFQMYPDLVPPKPTQSYVPRIYGFKIHKPQTAHTQQPQPQPAQQAQSRQNSAGAIATPPTTAGSVNTTKGKK